MRCKPAFGKDVSEFLNTVSQNKGYAPIEKSCGEIRIVSCVARDEKVNIEVLVSNPSGSEKCSFLLMREHYEELNISVGEISLEILPELEYFADVAKAYSSACSSFAYAPSSLLALRKKLLQKGFSSDICDNALECVRSRGFIDESEIARRRAQIMVEKRWGRSRIISKLREEGFLESGLEGAIEYLSSVDFSDICAELILKKFGGVPADKSERDKMLQSLSRMGYSVSDIKLAIKRI